MVSQKIKWLRNKLQLTQAELASKLGVSPASVNLWEAGKSLPKESHIKAIDSLYSSQNGRHKIMLKNGPTAFAFFAGGGGMHLGLEQAGINVLLSTDFEREAERTHKLNWPELPFICKDIQQLTPGELIQATGQRQPDIFCGGPPCQGFSTIGDKRSADPRNGLFEAYVRLVDKVRPKVVILENVKSMTTMYGGRYAQWVVNQFSAIGYKVYMRVFNAADFGVPQVRHRVFIIACRSGSPFAFPKPTHGPKLKPYVGCGKLLSDLATKGQEVPNHIALEHSEIVQQRYKLIPEGGRLPPKNELPKEIRRGNFGSTYKRLHRERPSLTMVPGNNAFPIHPTLNRSLTPREAARLQTFPDNHIFTGDRRRQCILVGNAVPPMLAAAIGKSVIAHLEGRVNAKEADSPCVVANEKTKGETSLQSFARNSNASFRFADLFSGAGGFLIGHIKAGWSPALSVDFNKNVAATHGKNFPAVPFLQGDLSSETVLNEIISILRDKDLAAVVGGPPCQGFSVMGKRRFVHTRGHDPEKDERNKLVYSFIKVVKEVKPRWFVMENVPGLANLDEGEFLLKLIKKYKDIGYTNVEWRILNAADYGVPQLRRRLIVIGNRTGHIIPWPKQKFYGKPTSWQKGHRTVGDAITDLAEKASYNKHTCHVPMNHKPLLVERYKYIPEGGRLNVDKLPPHLKAGYRTEEVKNYSHVFKRLNRNLPSGTMVPGHNAFPIHPWLNRALTVREAARLQTFPDEIEFMGPRQEQCIQVGNAFPPLLAEAIAINIEKAEINGWFPGRVPPQVYNQIGEEKSVKVTEDE